MVLESYGINNPSRIINLDDTGVPFKFMTTKRVKRGIAKKNKKLFKTINRTREDLDRLIIMSVRSASRFAFTLVVVMTRKKLHYRRSDDGQINTIQKYLLKCCLYQRHSVRVDFFLFLTTDQRILLRKQNQCVPALKSFS